MYSFIKLYWEEPTSTGLFVENEMRVAVFCLRVSLPMQYALVFIDHTGDTVSHIDRLCRAPSKVKECRFHLRRFQFENILKNITCTVRKH